MIPILIVEDDAGHRSFIVRLCSTTRHDLDIHVASTAEEALQCLRQQHMSIVLCDINLPGGLMVERLRELPEEVRKRSLFIFLTAHHEYALQATQFNLVAYLVKPYTANALREAIERACEQVLMRRQAQLAAVLFPSVTLNGGSDALAEAHAATHATLQICSVQGDRDWVQLHYINGETKADARRLKAWIDAVPELFVQIHKSTVVNLLHVLAWRHQKRDGVVTLRNGQSLKMSATYKSAFIEQHTRFRQMIYGGGVWY
jgi:DNA-binding LytR/AlgR family response regulator